MPGKRSMVGAVALAGLVLLAGCAGDPSTTGADPAAPSGVNETADVVSAVHTDPALAALLPADVRSAGALNFAAVTPGSPPFQYFTDNNTRHIGLEIDLRSAVAKVLGLTVHEQLTSFESVLPGLADGKYDVGQGNFGVTEERKHTVDFVTYYDDDYGFAVAAGSSIKHVTAVTDLCGLRVATGVGTDFATTLQVDAKQCDAAGKPEYTISTYADRAAGLLAVTQHHADIELLTAIGLEYQATQSKGQLVYLGKLPDQHEHIGFALKKGSPLDVPIQRAVQELIDNGSYARILAKWGLADAAITQSQLNPPGLT